PIVGTRVGGTEEVLVEDGAWPIAEDEGAEAYVRAIQEVLADRPAARDRARALRGLMLRERTPEAFESHAVDVLLRDRSDGTPR
ncbi:MAG TPA: hypothetical protein VH228_01745, partial [Nocardioides sp.]|nr:hypothetical protein [Nocardioides sp.]